MRAIELIEAQQKGIEGTAPWMVGEQLKEICRRESDSAALIEKDLEVEGMGLADAERAIKAYADKQKRSGNCVCVPPNIAEGIIRKIYGLPDIPAGSANISQAEKKSGNVIKLEDFW